MIDIFKKEFEVMAISTNNANGEKFLQTVKIKEDSDAETVNKVLNDALLKTAKHFNVKECADISTKIFVDNKYIYTLNMKVTSTVTIEEEA